MGVAGTKRRERLERDLVEAAEVNEILLPLEIAMCDERNGRTNADGLTKLT